MERYKTQEKFYRWQNWFQINVTCSYARLEIFGCTYLDFSVYEVYE